MGPRTARGAKVPDIKTLHRRAMELADQALAAQRRGDADEATNFFHEAFQLESRAASMLSSVASSEPNRSILLRSAATLAIDCGLMAEAEKLACSALAGDHLRHPIAEELRDVMERVYRKSIKDA